MSEEWEFRVEVSIDNEAGEVLAAYFHVREGAVARTVEVVEGKLNADYDGGGRLVGVELLAPCEVMVLEAVVRQEPEPVRRFLRGAAPRELVAA